MVICKDWMTEAATELAAGVVLDALVSRDQILAIIAKHCPFKLDTAYVEMSPSYERQIDALKTLLRESKREHCDCSRSMTTVEGDDPADYPCTCGADAWNTRVEEALCC